MYKFKIIKFFESEKFSIDFEENSKKFYVSIPVANPFTQYEEHYEISEADAGEFAVNLEKALPFVQACRRREKDGVLLDKPGKFRGDPV